MRRLALSLALVVSLLIPASASAASARCTVNISPSAGSPTDTYRITVSNVPVVPGVSVEVRINIKRLGSREGSVYFVSVFPDLTAFYVDHNVSPPGEPSVPLVPGRYRALVTTPHIHGGCNATASFVVRG